MTEETIEHMASVVEAKGTDAFWQAPIEELLPESLKSEAPKLEKRLETMDVWFDSGTSWAGCVEGTEGLSFPADLYLEVSKDGVLLFSSNHGRTRNPPSMTHGRSLRMLDYCLPRYRSSLVLPVLILLL